MLPDPLCSKIDQFAPKMDKNNRKKLIIMLNYYTEMRMMEYFFKALLWRGFLIGYKK